MLEHSALDARNLAALAWTCALNASLTSRGAHGPRRWPCEPAAQEMVTAAGAQPTFVLSPPLGKPKLCSTLACASAGLDPPRECLVLGSIETSAASASIAQVRRERCARRSASWRPPHRKWAGEAIDSSGLTQSSRSLVADWYRGRISGHRCLSSLLSDDKSFPLAHLGSQGECGDTRSRDLLALFAGLSPSLSAADIGDALNRDIFSRRPDDVVHAALEAVSVKEGSPLHSHEINLGLRALVLTCSGPHKQQWHHLRFAVWRELLTLWREDSDEEVIDVRDDEPFDAETEVSGPEVCWRASALHAKLEQELTLEEEEVVRQAVQGGGETTDLTDVRGRYIHSVLQPQYGRFRDLVEQLESRDVFSILGVPAGCSDEELRRAYMCHARRLHPDKGGHKEAFQELSDGYNREMERRGTDRHGRVFASSFGFGRSSSDGPGSPTGLVEPADGSCGEGVGRHGHSGGSANESAGAMAREMASLAGLARREAMVAGTVATSAPALRRRLEESRAEGGELAELSDLVGTLELRCRQIVARLSRLVSLATTFVELYGWVRHEHVAHYAAAYLRLSKAQPDILMVADRMADAARTLRSASTHPKSEAPQRLAELLLQQVIHGACAALEGAEAASEVADLARIVAEKATRSRQKEEDGEEARARDKSEDELRPGTRKDKTSSCTDGHSSESDTHADVRSLAEARLRQHRALRQWNRDMSQLKARARKLLHTKTKDLLPRIGLHEKHRVFMMVAESYDEALYELEREFQNGADGQGDLEWQHAESAVERQFSFVLGRAHTALDVRQAMFRYAACIDASSLLRTFHELIPCLEGTLRARIRVPPGFGSSFLARARRVISAVTTDDLGVMSESPHRT